MVALIILGGCAVRARGPAATGSASRRSTAAAAAVGVAATTAPAPIATRAPAVPSSPVTSRPVTTTVARASTTTGRPTSTTPASRCPSSLAGQLASTGRGTQLVTVEAPTASSTTATLTLWERSGTCWSAAAGPWPARLGRNGVSTHHREGDGTTPVGDFGISSTFYGIGSDPGVRGSYHQLVCGDWWDEDPSSPQYNSFQHVPCGARPPFGGGSEALWQAIVAYQRLAVVEYNTAPVVSDAGSGIFIHDDFGTATNGCVSLAPANLDSLLRWLQPGQTPHIVIGTSNDIRQF